MRVLVACEESQAVCIAFRERGHEAYSCDILPCSGGHPEWHIQGDVLEQLDKGWDMMIGHPPCTYLSFAAMSYWNEPGRIKKRLDALEFFRRLWEAPIEKICLENPKSVASPVIAKYTQEIQPYYFGEREFKTTWLWLKNLPMLIHVKEDNLFEVATHTPRPEPKAYNKNGKAIHWCDYHGPSEDRANLRSKTFSGIARAYAEQWG